MDKIVIQIRLYAWSNRGLEVDLTEVLTSMLSRSRGHLPRGQDLNTVEVKTSIQTGS